MHAAGFHRSRVDLVVPVFVIADRPDHRMLYRGLSFRGRRDLREVDVERLCPIRLSANGKLALYTGGDHAQRGAARHVDGRLHAL